MYRNATERRQFHPPLWLSVTILRGTITSSILCMYVCMYPCVVSRRASTAETCQRRIGPCFISHPKSYVELPFPLSGDRFSNTTYHVPNESVHRTGADDIPAENESLFETHHMMRKAPDLDDMFLVSTYLQCLSRSLCCVRRRLFSKRDTKQDVSALDSRERVRVLHGRCQPMMTVVSEQKKTQPAYLSHSHSIHQSLRFAASL